MSRGSLPSAHALSRSCPTRHRNTGLTLAHVVDWRVAGFHARLRPMRRPVAKLRQAPPVLHPRELLKFWRLLAVVACLLFAQALTAAHVDNHSSHHADAECQLCQAYERSALPGPRVAFQCSARFVSVACALPGVQRPQASQSHSRPPSRAPPH